MISLCDIIKQNKSLGTVTLGENEIDDHGASAIAEAIKQSTSLTAIHLTNNSIGAIGKAAISEAIKQNKLLTNVDLKHNTRRSCRLGFFVWWWNQRRKKKKKGIRSARQLAQNFCFSVGRKKCLYFHSGRFLSASSSKNPPINASVRTPLQTCT